MSVWNWVVAHWSIIAEVLTVLVAAIVVYAKGKSAEVAGQVIALIVALSKKELKDVTEADMYNVGLYLYAEYVPAIAKVLVTDQMFATGVVKLWEKFIAMYAAEKTSIARIMA